MAALAVLSEVDRVAVRIGDPSRSEVGLKVVWWAERRRTLGNQTRIIAVDIVSPEKDPNGPSAEARIQPVILNRGLD